MKKKNYKKGLALFLSVCILMGGIMDLSYLDVAAASKTGENVSEEQTEQ